MNATYTTTPLQLVICGTDTDVGKTVVSALVVQGLGAHYWKPVQCGLENGEGDRDRLQRWLHWPAEQILPEAYRFLDPVSPHWAAERASGDPQHPGPPIDPARLQLPAVAGPLVVETAGGLLVPLRRDRLQIEQLQTWGLPVLLVARSGLGTLNHTLLSLEALQQRRIPVLGVLFNGTPHADNPRTIADLAGVPVLGTLPPLAAITPQTLQQQWQALDLSHKLRPRP
jgi:dethiobiotin synthetase